MDPPRPRPPTTPVNPQTASPLATVPDEVLARITRHLTTPELCDMRTVCKLIEQRMHHTFSREFFRRKQFMISTPSLDALLAIVRHPLGAGLKHIAIGTDMFGMDLHMRVDLNRDQDYLIRTGAYFETLATVFTELGDTLQTLDIRDFNSKTRYRDTDYDKPIPPKGSWRDNVAEWSSYGAVLARELTHGEPLPLKHFSNAFVASIFQNILRALAISRTTPPNLEIVVRADGLPDSAFFIPPALKDPLTPYLLNLKKLHLAVSFRYRGGDTCLRRFIAACPNVTWLRLNFQQSGEGETPAFLQWLSGNSSDSKGDADAKSGPDEDRTAELFPYSNFAPPSPQPGPPALNLEQLELGMCALEPAVLAHLFGRFQVRETSLHRVTLFPSKTPRDPAADDDDSDGQANKSLWSGFIRGLSGSKVRVLRLSLLGEQQQRPGERYHVGFGDGGALTGKVVEYAGGTADEPWDALAREVLVKIPAPVASYYGRGEDSSDSNDSSEEDDEDDEDGDEDDEEDGDEDDE